MEIKTMSTSEIRPYERNPRINNDAVDAVAKSIKEFGWRVPIIVDKDLVIIAGHTRLKAAQQLGLTAVPVHVAENLTDEQVKAYRIADNKTAELSEWDYELLPLELQELSQAEFDLSLLGFDTQELEELLGSDDSLAEGQTEADAIPEVPEEAVSVLGEVYTLGEHRLMCGDATSSEELKTLLGDDEIKLFLIDPPYNVALTGSTGLTIQNDDMDSSDFKDFLERAFSAASVLMSPGISFYIFHSDSESANFRLACKTAGLDVRQTLYWVKNAFVLSRFDYHYQSESILYGWTPGAAHRWFNDRCQANVLNFDKPKLNDVHPSMKPVELLTYLIKNSTVRDEVVLDSFGGSGSTLIACEQTGRKCRMMELDPKYCDVIRQRWAEFIYGEGCNWQELTAEKEETGDDENN